MRANKAITRKIFRGYESFIEREHLEWDQKITNITDQPRFVYNVECKYIKVIGKLNDWIIVKIQKKKIIIHRQWTKLKKKKLQ